MTRIFHIATVLDWTQAQRTGSYTTSTLGRTLAQEGFLHASRADQWQGVQERFYADVTEPLILLVIDPDKLTSPLVVESVSDSSETFPHIYGPLNPDAVVQTIALDGRPVVGESFSRLFLQEVFRRILLATWIMVAIAVGAVTGDAATGEWGALIGAVLGLIVGVGAVVGLKRARRPRPDTLG